MNQCNAMVKYKKIWKGKVRKHIILNTQAVQTDKHRSWIVNFDKKC